MPRTPEKTERQRQTEASPERRAEEGVRSIEKRIAPEVRVLMNQIQECPYEPELPNVKPTEWNLAKIKILGDVHFIPGRDGKSLLIGTLKVVNGVHQWQRVGAESLSPSLIMAAKLSLGLEPSSPALPEPTKVTTHPTETKTQTPATPERSRETIVPGTENTPERLLEAFRGIRITVDGRDVPVNLDAKIASPTALQSLLKKNSISTARYPTYAQNMRDHARVLSAALAGKNPRSVTFDGLRFSVVDGSRTIVSTATRAYGLDARGNVSTLSGTRVNFQDKPSGFEVTVNGRREIHRADGGLAVAEQGGVRQFFDGSNQVPILEQQNGETFIVGASGSRVGMRPRGSIRSLAEAGEWGATIAQKLRTPEAIGAFVSQFFYGQDYQKSSEQTEWRNNQIQRPASAIQYQKENSQDVQHWQRTLFQRSGDCEDFALLAQGLLAQAGIKSFTSLVTPSHYETVYFESAGTDQSGRETYFVCTVGLRGFQRSTQAFSNLGEAVQSLWEPLRSGASSASRFVLKSGPDGAVIHDQPKNPSDKKADVYTADYSDDVYFRQFIRR